MKKIIISIIFIFIPLFSFAQNEDLSNEQYSESETGSVYIEENNQSLLIPDTASIDVLISDIESFSILKEQYDALYKELYKDIDLKIKEIDKQEQTSISEIENFPWLPNELDENGEPTEIAKAYRSKNIEGIKERFNNERNEIKSGVFIYDTEEMIKIKIQIDTKVKELSEKEYIYFDNNYNIINFETEKVYKQFTNNNGAVDEGFFITSKVDLSTIKNVKYSDSGIVSLSLEAFPKNIAEEFKSNGIIPFYTEGIFTLNYDENDMNLVLILKNQVFHLIKDNSVLDSRKQKLNKVEVSSTNTKASTTEKKNKKPNKQDGRTGIYVNGFYGLGPYGNFYSIGEEIIWSTRNYIYTGLSTTVQFHKIDDKYKSPYEKFTMISIDGLLGATVTLWKLQPYAQIGAGFGVPVIANKKNKETVVCFNGYVETGVDIHFTNISIGAVYKFDFFKDCGASDSFGITLGYTF